MPETPSKTPLTDAAALRHYGGLDRVPAAFARRLETALREIADHRGPGWSDAAAALAKIAKEQGA